MVDLAEYGIAESDLQFLRQKELEGNLIIVRATRATTGEIVAYTPASGKTFFLYRASIANAIGSSTPWCHATVQNDGTIVDDLSAAGEISTRIVLGGKFTSVISGDSLIGDGVKKYRINAENIAGTWAGTLIGWIEDT